MKKLFLFLVVLFGMFAASAQANVDDDVWSYFFHLEYKQGVLSVESEAKHPYDLVPEQYSGPDAAATDFYGIVTGIKNTELARFGFDKPATEVATLGKSVFDAKGPYFADADHVTFFAKGGKKLFAVSVKESSFCNDDKKCTLETGENYRNCPLDCPVPADVTPVAPVSAPQPSASPVALTTTPSPEASTPSPAPAAGAPSVTSAESPGTHRTLFAVIAILALLVASVLWYLRRKSS